MSSNSKQNTISVCNTGKLGTICCHYVQPVPLSVIIKTMGALWTTKPLQYNRVTKPTWITSLFLFYSLQRVNNKLTQQCARNSNKWITVTTIIINNYNNNGSKVVQHTPFKLCENCLFLLHQPSKPTQGHRTHTEHRQYSWKSNKDATCTHTTVYVSQ